MRRMAIICLMSVVFGSACSRTGSPLSPTSDSGVESPSVATSPGGSTASLAGELALCADETNRYRSTVGLGPLVRSAALEDFASHAAQEDAAAHVAHKHFALTNGAGVSRAETEILWWRGLTVPTVVQRGLAQMWQVGPGGEHYDIMAGTYSEIGCGIAVNGSEVTVTQDFR
jgi:uncharacterized protein YkwD